MTLQWLSEEQLCALLKESDDADVSGRQLKRWAYEGLLRIRRVGKITYYPPNSRAQAIAISDLLREKRKVEFVGRELWWQGYYVDEKFWKPELQKTARMLDRFIKHIRSRMDIDDRSDNEPTIFDMIAKSKASNIVLSRLRKRLGDADNLAMVLRVLLQSATGNFDGFEHLTGDDPRTDEQKEAGIKWRSDDESQMIRALCVGQSEKDVINGQRLDLIGVLLTRLEDISKALGSGRFVDVLKRPEDTIINARDDIRNAMRLVQALFEATRGIYGQEAFGLKLGEWIAKKSDRRMKLVFLLIWARLRDVTKELLPSRDIATLASEAEKLRGLSEQLKLLGQDTRYAAILSPRRLRSGLRDELAMKAIVGKIEAATIS
jgi:hypothetical protein